MYLQISFAAASSALRDRTRFKGNFRTTPSFNNYAPAVVALFNKYKWRRVSFITQAENLFKQVCVQPKACINEYLNVQ